MCTNCKTITEALYSSVRSELFSLHLNMVWWCIAAGNISSSFFPLNTFCHCDSLLPSIQVRLVNEQVRGAEETVGKPFHPLPK